MADIEPLLTPAEVAALLQVDPKTVARWAAKGKLPSLRTPGGHRRYRQADVQHFIGDRHETKDNGAVTDTEIVLLTSGDVATMFGVDRTTVVRWATTGVLPCIRTPSGHRRFLENDVRQLQQERAEKQHE